jgi:hypothetical protein
LIRRRNDSTEEELWFDFADRSIQRVILPVIHAGQLVIYEWGNRSNPQTKLPKTGWCRKESLDAGKWRWLHPEPVDIPCSFGLEKGVWFQITEGIRGVLVRDEAEAPHVYMLTEAASHYYQIMTRHDRMPLLIDQRI